MTLKNEIETERLENGIWRAVFSWHDGKPYGNPVGRGETEDEAIMQLIGAAIAYDGIDAGLDYIFDLAIAKWKELRDA